MRKMKDKVKRKHYDWYKALLNCNDPSVHYNFCFKCGHLYKGRRLSNRRLAYYVLKSYYHTTTIDELAEKLGL